MNEKLKNKPWSDSSLPTAVDETLTGFNGTFSYTITGNMDSGYIMESIGKFGLAERTVTGTLSLHTVFEFAIFGGEGVELKNSTVIDGYNWGGEEGTLKVGTNATGKDDMTLHNDCFVNGDVLIGFEGDLGNVIKLDVGASYTGDGYAMTEILELPPVMLPEWLESLPSQGEIMDPGTITSSGKYSGIDLKNSEILLIDGDVTLYITGTISLDTNGQLQIVNTNPNASLTLYLEDKMITNNGGFINNLTQDPQKLRIYGLGDCDQIEMKTDGNLYGVIYAPNTDVIMRNAVNIYGSVIAKTFKQFKAANFNYYASLRDVTPNDNFVRFEIERWSEE